MDGDVRVKVPALKRYGPMAEIAAVHAARHQGFPSEEIDELSKAIKEALLLLLDPELPDGSISFSYQSKAGIITIEAQLVDPVCKPIPHSQIDRFESTAGPLVDSWKLDPDERRLWLQKSTKSNSA